MKTADVLVYHGKHGDEYWLVDTPARRDAAFRALFKMLDDFHCYAGGGAKFREMLGKASNGDTQCVKAILESRFGYEYEGWDIVQAEIAQ